MSIQIITRLDTRLNCGDGEQIEKSYGTTAKSLIVAANKLNKIRNSKTQAYGNIGHAGTWIRVDGVDLDMNATTDIEHEVYKACKRDWESDGSIYPSKLELAQDIIDESVGAL